MPLISVVLVAESQHIEVMRLLSLLAPAVALVLDEKSLEAASSSRPVSKVVSLLQGMKEQLESEASEEAELMEKYNCWCKENGEAKEKAILEATSRIEEWENRIAELSAMSSRLGTEYKNLQEEVDKNQASMDESMALRKKEVAKFHEEEKELFNSLNSVKSAQIVLNSSSFLQRPSLQKLQVLASRQADRLSDRAAKQLASFLQDPGAGSVKGVLDGLEIDFNSSLKDLHDTEKENKGAYEKLIKAKREEIDSANVQIQTKKEEKANADEELLQKKQDVKDAKGSKDEDLAFAKEVQEKCAAKEKAWEQRQQTRADETQAVSKAIEVLDSDASHELFGKTMKPSLIQLASKEDPMARRSQLYDRLRAAGKAQKDLRLVTLSLEAKLDSFTEVQEKIDAMVAALKKEQADEVKKKDYCIEELNKNKISADGKKRQGEGLDATVQDLKEKLKAVEVDTKELDGEVLELKKQQKLAAQNREKENSEFQKVVQEQRQTQVLLKKAMQVLAGFYNKPLESFLQDPKEPETFGSYKKAGGNGVMLMLQQLIADAKAMEVESSTAEREAQKDYEAFGKETINALKTKGKALEDKAAEKAKLEEKFVMTRQSKKGVEKEVDTLADTEVLA